MNSFIRDKVKIDAVFQILLIDLLLMFFWDIALLSKYTDKSNILIVVLFSVILNGSFLFLLYCLFGIKKYRFNIKDKIRGYFRNKYIFIIISIIFISAFLLIINAWLNLDGYIYYTYICDMKNWKLGSLTQLMLAGHSSQGYSIFLLIGEFIFPNNVLGVRIIQCLMALITIYCFYKIVSCIVISIDNTEKFLFTSIFAFSPMMLGMTAEINTDFPLLCFFTWMLCCGIKNKKILQTFCGVLLCFSKETGVLLYGFYLFGIVVFRIFKNIRKPFKEILKCIFSLDIWLSAIGGVLWIINYIYLAVNNASVWGTSISNGAQSQDTVSIGHKINSVGIYKDYIINKLKQMLYINFNWIMYSLILICIFLFVLEGKKIFARALKLKGEYYLALIFSFFAFILYNCIYITYNHYRYLLPFAIFVSLSTVISLVTLFKNKVIQKCISAILVIVLFISNFYTFDPLALKMFMKEGTGTGNILIPCTLMDDASSNVYFAKNTDYNMTIINGSGIYNMQYAFLGKCFDKTLEYVNYSEDTLIVMPCEYRDEYGTIASIFGINLTGVRSFYWDSENKETVINNQEVLNKLKIDDKYKRINMRVLNSINDIDATELKKYSKVYYIALPFDNKYDHESFFNGMSHKKIKSIQYISWKWDLYQILN